MRDNVLVIPSRADGEGPRYRNKIHTRNAFAINEVLASNKPTFGLCNLKANVSPSVRAGWALSCAAQDDAQFNVLE
jgi:hypothetical protein